ncbi:MAG: hypothetical protein IJS60_01775 [Abditibacteriota bacterium]|nr:hypothetical protein [Abditibacteriota bacterium]
MSDELKNFGFDVVDKTIIVLKARPNDGLENIYKVLKENKIKLFVWLQAETAEQSTKTRTNKGGLFGAVINNLTVDKAKTKLVLRFIDIDNGEVYFTKDVTAETGGVTLFGIGGKEDTVKKAISKFFKENAEELKAELFNKWVDVANLNVYSLEIKNIKRGQFKTLQSLIEQKDRFFKSFSKDPKLSNNSAIFNVRTKSEQDNFLDLLESFEIDNNIIEIDSVEGNNITGILIPKEQ